MVDKTVNNGIVPKTVQPNEGEKAKKGPSISQKVEKGPSLGFRNALKIAFQSRFQSIVSDKTAAQIRTELKHAILEKKHEKRGEAALSKTDAKSLEHQNLKTELAEQKEARKLGLTRFVTKLYERAETQSPTTLQGTPINCLENVKTAEEMQVRLSNFCDRLFAEIRLKNPEMQDVTQEAKSLVRQDIMNSLSMVALSLIDLDALKLVHARLSSDQRYEKAAVVKEIYDVIKGFTDPDGKVFDQNKQNALAVLDKEVAKIGTGTTFMRNQDSNQINLFLWALGGQELREDTKNYFIQDSETSFTSLPKALRKVMGDGDISNVSKSDLTVDLLLHLDQVNEELLDHVAKGVTPEFKQAMGELANHVVGLVARNKATKEQGETALTLLCNMVVLRFIGANVTETLFQNGDGQDALMAAMKHLQSIVSATKLPSDMKPEVEEQYAASMRDIAGQIEKFRKAVGLFVPNFSEAVEEWRKNAPPPKEKATVIDLPQNNQVPEIQNQEVRDEDDNDRIVIKETYEELRPIHIPNEREAQKTKQTKSGVKDSEN